MKKLPLFFFCTFVAIASCDAADIRWVSFHPADDTPSAAAATAGFTMAVDVGYTDALEAAGHTVTRIVTSDIPNSASLNGADLVIISRSVPSVHYELDAETAAWNGITAPMMIMGGYVLRNSRLGFTTGGTIPDTTGTVSLTATNPAHPIFVGITLDAGNTMVNPYAGIVVTPFNGTTQRGISVNTDPLAGNGTILATIGTPGDPTFGGMVIAEWAAGSIMGNSPPADTLGGRRLVFLSGSRENNGLTAEGAGIYDLNTDGTRMFLNAVNYMAIPEPATAALLALGGVPFFFRRKKA